MKRFLVIGIGSLIMTDDGIGSRIAGALKSRLIEQNISVLIGETDFAYCFEEIYPDDYLFIIDAVVEQKEPGSILLLPLGDALNGRFPLSTQHNFSLFDAININYPKIEGWLIGIEAAEIGFGFELSPALKPIFDKLCGDVFNIILKLKEAALRA